MRADAAGLPGAMFDMEGPDFTSGPGYLSTKTFSLLAPLMLIGLGIALGTGAIATEEERRTKAVRVDLLACSDIHISFKARFDKP